MEQSKTLDNQQRSIEERLCWLGGIIDGEGCITAMAGHTKTGHGFVYKYRRYVPLINIVNTDKQIIDEVIDILKTVGIGFWVSEQGRVSKKHPTWKRKWEIMITGMKRCMKAAVVLEKYMVGEKHTKLLYLKQWVSRRLSETPKAPYTQEDYALLSLIRDSSIPLRDYTPNSTTKVDEDIVQTTQRCVEVA